jgi:hypothetical protein
MTFVENMEVAISLPLCQTGEGQLPTGAATDSKFTMRHDRMKRGGHGLPKVSPGHVMPYSYAPCRQATSETALQPFQGLPARRAGGLWPSSIPLDTPHHIPML